MAFGAWDGLSNLADSVLSDLGAFGVIGQPNVGGHQTTQVVRQTAPGVTTTITSSSASPVSQTQSYVLIGGALLLIVGLFLLLPKKN